MFVSFEGIEGSGKSTQARRLAALLGARALLTQEPGGTALGRAIRALLLDPRNGALASVSEILLYCADRAQHVAEVVRPALAAGRIVLTDRYLDSSLAYQGYGRGLPLELIRDMGRAATGGLQPDLTLLFDLPVSVGLKRVGKRGPQDRLESEAREFHERVRAGYLEMATAEPTRWVVLDGQGSEAEVAERLDAAIRSRGLDLGVADVVR